MKKYSCYIPAVLILLLFCSLLLFRGSLIRYASRIMTDGMEPEEKSIVENILFLRSKTSFTFEVS